MDAISTRMLLGAAGKKTIVLPNIGDAFEGGYYAGLISHTANGVATHALIVSPRSSARGNGYSGSDLPLESPVTGYVNATSEYDGAANTAAYSNSGAATYCAGLTIGGYSDWYLPAIMELEIAYFNLKPKSTNNNTSYGTNPYSVPRRNSNYTSTNPTVTASSNFQAQVNPEGLEKFETQTNGGVHWSSTNNGTNYGKRLDFTSGYIQATANKLNAEKVRAFRRIAL